MTKVLARCLISMSLCLAAMNVGAQARVYKWVDADGVVHFSDEPPKKSEGAAAEVVVVPSSAPPVGAQRADRDRAVEPTPIAEATAAASVQPSAPASTQAQGPDCGSASPRQRSGLDIYEFDDDPPEPLASEEIQAFAIVTKAMAERWSGTDVGFACDGAAKRALNRSVVSDGRARSPDEFLLDSTISSRDSNRRELLRIELRDGRLWVNQGYGSLISVSDRVLAFGYRERRAGVVWEQYWEIELDGQRAMTVEHATYTNGILTELSTWETRKPY